MAVRIRLLRRGRKKLAIYDIVVADARSPRDGKFIEKLGTYNPNTDPATINLDADGAFDWVMKGAQPSDTARAILSYRGVMLKKHLQIGVNKGAITQEEADKRFAEWSKAKEGKIDAKIEGLEKGKAAADKSRMEAETKVKEARAEALQKKQSEMIAAEEAAAAADKATDEPQAEEAVAETVAVEAPEVKAVEEVAEPVASEEPAVEAEVAAPVEEAVVETEVVAEAAAEVEEVENKEDKKED